MWGALAGGMTGGGGLSGSGGAASATNGDQTASYGGFTGGGINFGSQGGGDQFKWVLIAAAVVAGLYLLKK